jgi:hypothetical protein
MLAEAPLLAEFVDVAVAPSMSTPCPVMPAHISVRWMTTDWPDGNDDVLHVTTR